MESFEQLASQYEPMIHRIINTLHIYKNKDEFHQHGLIALWEASKHFDSKKGQLSTFAYAYIKGYLLMELSKATKESERSIYPKGVFWENAVDPYSESLLEKEILFSYCHNLTPHQKKWFLLSTLEGLSVNEIAKMEKVSVSAVKSWQKGARERLKVAMEK
ncbi:DNA-directed RNA polymerase [Neobacillus niacini]|uniref:sigma-70 family RNA polymerase sigma factor n=1 Tax=Neobacillus niacini TaxID=86668 RepID=UPI0028608C39|nr:sigma-70 family RNA polymerase sigma factor [Neobacillus niacini]MDR7078903.1 DNA-directed RNA polymerase [Neobacillus niacini]